MHAFVAKKNFAPVPFDTINGTPEGKSRYSESILQPTGQQMTAKLRMCVGERLKKRTALKSSLVS